MKGVLCLLNVLTSEERLLLSEEQSSIYVTTPNPGLRVGKEKRPGLRIGFTIGRLLNSYKSHYK
jgi:hypothetical protein